MNLTDEQQAIIEYVRNPKGDLLIEATAGSGKTLALIKSLEVIPQRSMLVCAFNRKIADELTACAPKPRKGSAMHVKTFHQIGLGIIKAYYPKLAVDKNGTEMIITKALDGRAFAYPMRRAAVKLLRQYKELDASDGVSIGDIGNPEDIIEVGRNYDVFGKLSEVQIDGVVDVVLTAYQMSHHPENLEAIDFCDMIWLPIALNLTPPSRYQAIIIDEYQDCSSPQLELIRRLCAPNGGRLIMAGDRFQAINQWRGAVASEVRSMMLDERKAKVLTLTTSFRCSKAVINEARALVPEIKACSDALDGTVSRVALSAVPRMIFQRYSETIHTFILSRANAPLLDTALYLWREGVRFQLNAGQEMLGPLFELLEILDLRTPDLFRSSLNAWWGEATTKAEVANALELVERLNDQRTMLLSAIGYTAPSGLKRLFQSILEPGKTGVMLSTVHKVKGLEADRVFLLRQTFGRHQPPRRSEAFSIGQSRPIIQGALVRRNTAPGAMMIVLPGGQQIGVGDWVDGPFNEPTEEDINIEYVAITRAKEHLIWVDIDKREIETAPDPTLALDLIKSLTHEGLAEAFEHAEAEMTRLAGINDQDGADEWATHAKAITDEQARRKAQ